MRTCPTCRYKHPMIIIQIPIFIVKSHDSNAVLSCWLFSFSNFTMQRKQRSPPTGGRGRRKMILVDKFSFCRPYIGSEKTAHVLIAIGTRSYCHKHVWRFWYHPLSSAYSFMRWGQGRVLFVGISCIRCLARLYRTPRWLHQQLMAHQSGCQPRSFCALPTSSPFPHP